MKLISYLCSLNILFVFLTSCNSQPNALPREESTPTQIPSTPIPTTTLIPFTITPSPLPTQPIIPIITPDSVQAKKWREYENALAEALFPSSFIPGEFLCEWEILGQSNQDVYVWTVCMSIFSVESTGLPYHVEMPAAIHIDANGTIQSVEIPGAHYGPDIRRMFPTDVQEKYFSKLIHFQELTDHLQWRREHPNEPPLVVVDVIPMP